jgi:hypothetical protein
MSTFRNIGITNWLDPVATAGSLPLVGNQEGDARVVIDEGAVYAWDGSSWVAGGGGGGGDSFGTIQVPAGTNPVADQTNDTLTLESSDSSITITGNSTTDTVNFVVASDGVANTQLANMATQTIKGRTTAGTGDPEDLTATQATAILNNVVGDSGSGGTKGLVPAPASGDAAANKFLKADGTWTAVAATTVDSIPFSVINPIDRDYDIDYYAPGSYTINSIGIICSTGTCTAAIKINGTNVTSLSGLSVTTGQLTASASGANTVVAGDRVTLTVSSASVIQNLSLSLKVTRS